VPGHVEQLAVDRDARVVDPRVEAAEARDRLAGDATHVLLPPHVRDDVSGLAARAFDLPDELFKRLLAPRGDDEARAAFGRRPRGDESDAARSAGDYDDLILQLFEFNAHHSLLVVSPKTGVSH